MAHPSENYTELTRFHTAERLQWVEDGDQDWRFYFGEQWTQEELNELRDSGLPDPVINRIRPTLKHINALLSASRPVPRFVPISGGDIATAHLFSEVASYVWRLNQGDRSLERSIGEMLVRGLGWLLVWWDSEADEGRGEVRIQWVSPRDVFVDPAAMAPDLSDASSLYLARRLTVTAAQEAYPGFSDEEWMEAQGVGVDIQPFAGTGGPMGGRGESLTPMDPSETRVLVLERYKRELETLRWQVLDEEGRVLQVVEGPRRPPAPPKGVHLRPVRRPRIRVEVTAGASLEVVDYLLPPSVTTFPLVPFINEDRGNPYPLGEVHFLRQKQRLINKLWSLAVVHFQKSAHAKVLLQENSFSDLEEAERSWSNPGSFVLIREGATPPVVVNPSPVSGDLLMMPERLAREIEIDSGAFTPNMGDASQAPETYRGTLILREFGSERSRILLRSVGYSIQHLSRLILQFSQGYYTQPKILRLVNDEGQPEVVQVNEVENALTNLSVGRYDVAGVVGENLPTLRMAVAQLYMEVAKIIGPAVNKYLIKYLDLPDAPAILRDMDIIAQLQQQLQSAGVATAQMQQEIKRLSHISEAAQREGRLAQFESKLDSEKEKAEATLQDLGEGNGREL